MPLLTEEQKEHIAEINFQIALVSGERWAIELQKKSNDAGGVIALPQDMGWKVEIVKSEDKKCGK